MENIQEKNAETTGPGGELGEKAQESAPKELVKRGRVHMNLYDTAGFEEAVSCFREAHMTAPAYSPAYVGLAEVYSYWGFRREISGEESRSYFLLAFENAEIALKLAPDRGSSHRAMAVALRRGPKADPEKRLEEAEIALELSPVDAECWYEFWRASGYDADDPSIMKALELDPKLCGAHIDLGVAYCRDGRLKEAVRQLRKALQVNPRNTLAYYNLGMVLDRQNRRQEAREFLTRVKARHSDDTLIKIGLEILN